MRRFMLSRRSGVVALFLLVALCVTPALAIAAGRSSSPQGHLKHLTEAGHGTSGTTRGASPNGVVSSNQQFTNTANPLTLDPPIPVPNTTPTVVTLVKDQPFPNANNVQKTITLPNGSWGEVVLHVTGSESGRQYDRLLQVFDGSSPIYVGVTPEPVPAGITWNVEQDVTSYLPILVGQRTFTVNLDNYPNSVNNGIPVVTITLSFYRGSATHLSGTDAVPDGVASVSNPGTTSLDTIGANSTLRTSVTLPNDLTSVQLRFYAVAQIGEEFWWGAVPPPTFREIEVSVDGEPAGVVWPFPSIYTGGVNPLLWRPITGIHTLALPTYDVDLSPFAGLLGGTHTLSLYVQNNGANGDGGYWLADGSLLFDENHGHATTGKLLINTLSFPATDNIDYSHNGLGDANNPVTGESASRSYEIKGQTTDGHQTWTDDLTGSLQYSNDQTNTVSNSGTQYVQFVHDEQIASTTEVAQGPGGPAVTTKVNETYTLDAPNDYLFNSSGFLLPTEVAQSLDHMTRVQVGGGAVQQSHLYENVQGYASLEEDNGTPTITAGSTTGDVQYTATNGGNYSRLVVARGGVILEDNIANTLHV